MDFSLSKAKQNVVISTVAASGHMERRKQKENAGADVCGDGSIPVGMKISKLRSILNHHVDEDLVCEYPLERYAQFEALESTDMNAVFAISKFYGLSESMVERTMRGERTMLINDREVLDNTVEEWAEYNRIVLYKRLSFIINYVSLLSVKSEETLRSLGYSSPRFGIVVANQFKNGGRYTDDKVSTFFDGKCVRSGRWHVDSLVVNAVENNSVLFLPYHSVYPQNLCLRLNYGFDFYVVSTEMCRKLEGYRNVCSAVLFDAVPGSGKTTAMLEAVSKHPKQSLVVVATREEAKQMRERGLFGITVDSLHHSLVTIKRTYAIFDQLMAVKYVYVDECYMMHSGQISWILKKLKELVDFRSVWMYGDAGQVPYYAYVPVKIAHSRDMYNSVVERKGMDVTYRCPRRLCKFLSSVYGRKVVSKNEAGSFEYKVVGSDEIVRFVSGLPYTVLVYTQVEKQMLNFYNVECRTIAEVQGQTFSSVCLVRLNMYERTIYSSLPHITVALSRCTARFVYCTVKKDRMVEIVDAIMIGKDIKTKPVVTLGSYHVEVPRSWVHAYSLGYKRGVGIFENIAEQKWFNPLVDMTGIGRVRTDLAVDRPYIIANYEKVKDKLVVMAKEVCEFYTHRYLDRNLYMETVMHMKELLEDKDVHFNDVKFAAMLDADLRDYESKPYANVVEDKEPGSFAFSMLPRARLAEFEMLPLLTSIYKRNADPSQIRAFTMALAPADIIDKFMNKYVDERKFGMVKDMLDTFVKDYVAQWRMTRTLQQINKLDSERARLNDLDFTDYSAFVKSVVKNKFDDDAYNIDNAAQVVASAHAVMVEYFTPMVKRFTDILKSVLKSNVLINDGVTPNYLQWFLNSRVANSGVKQLIPLEMDYSKFDKNQDWTDLYYQLLILRKFGVPDDVLSDWASVHLVSKLKFYRYGINVRTFTQRKSGDAFTFMGNTLFTMLMFSAFYIDVEPVCMIFGGDDSLVIFDEAQRSKVLDYGDEIGAAFNMEIKYLDTTSSVMFASQFVLFEPEHIYVVPDILKQFARYNYRMDTKDHALAQQVSSYLLDVQLMHFGERLSGKYYAALFSRYAIDDKLREPLHTILEVYLDMVATGTTYLFYKDFNKLPLADDGQFDIIRKRLQKKVGQYDITKHVPACEEERQFIDRYKWRDCVRFKVGEEMSREHQINVDLVRFDDYLSLYQPFVDAVRSYFESNHISVPVNFDVIRSAAPGQLLKYEVPGSKKGWLQWLSDWWTGGDAELTKFKSKVRVAVQVGWQLASVLDVERYADMLNNLCRYLSLNSGCLLEVDLSVQPGPSDGFYF